jgi:hypothetical protein
MWGTSPTFREWPEVHPQAYKVRAPPSWVKLSASPRHVSSLSTQPGSRRISRTASHSSRVHLHPALSASSTARATPHRSAADRIAHADSRRQESRSMVEPHERGKRARHWPAHARTARSARRPAPTRRGRMGRGCASRVRDIVRITRGGYHRLRALLRAIGDESLVAATSHRMESRRKRADPPICVERLRRSRRVRRRGDVEDVLHWRWRGAHSGATR